MTTTWARTFDELALPAAAAATCLTNADQEALRIQQPAASLHEPRCTGVQRLRLVADPV
jgi:hypothetical protein